MFDGVIDDALYCFDSMYLYLFKAKFPDDTGSAHICGNLPSILASLLRLASTFPVVLECSSEPTNQRRFRGNGFAVLITGLKGI